MTSGLPEFAVPTAPFRGFDAAARTVLDLLHWRLGFGLWVVTELVSEHHVIRVARDERYDVREGAWYPWLDRYCNTAAQQAGPQLVWDCRAEPIYAAMPPGAEAPVSAYVGAPLWQTGGAMLGTICAFEPLPQMDEILGGLPLLQVVARLLSTVFVAVVSAAA